MSNLNFLHSGGNKVTLSAPDSNPSSDVTLKLPQADGSSGQAMVTNGSGALSFASMPTAGITEFDSWYHTSNKAGSTGVLDNVARNNFAAAASQIGTGMSESSGVFTFPRTGKYLIIFNGQFALNGSTNIVVYTQVTSNNGASYQNHARALDGNNGSGERSGSGASFAFIDVTDTSQIKVRFNVGVIGGSDQISGSTSFQTTTFTFIRIGDT